MQVVYIRV